MEEPSELQFKRLQRVRHNWVRNTHTHTYTETHTHTHIHSHTALRSHKHNVNKWVTGFQWNFIYKNR